MPRTITILPGIPQQFEIPDANDTVDVSAIEARLDALETRLDALEVKVGQNRRWYRDADRNIKARLDALEECTCIPAIPDNEAYHLRARSGNAYWDQISRDPSGR